MKVTVEITSIRCIETTDTSVGPFGGNRDEVYWTVGGIDKGGPLPINRLPKNNKGYVGMEPGDEITKQGLEAALRFFESWPGDLGRSRADSVRRFLRQFRLWEGNLNDDEYVSLTMALMEQDNDTFGFLVSLFQQSEELNKKLKDKDYPRDWPDDPDELAKAVKEVSEAINEIAKSVRTILSGTDHDLLGNFSVIVTNNAGKISSKWKGINQDRMSTRIFRSNARSAIFEMTNREHSSHYVVEIQISS